MCNWLCSSQVNYRSVTENMFTLYTERKPASCTVLAGKVTAQNCTYRSIWKRQFKVFLGNSAVVAMVCDTSL